MERLEYHGHLPFYALTRLKMLVHKSYGFPQVGYHGPELDLVYAREPLPVV